MKRASRQKKAPSLFRALRDGAAGLCILCFALFFLKNSGIWAKFRPNTGEDAPENGGLTLFCEDVGQGQALLLTCGDRAALVDTGLAGRAEGLLEALAEQGVTRLDYLFITHPHSDHCGGAKTVLSALPTDLLVVPDYYDKDALYIQAGEWLGAADTALDIACAGREYALGGASLTVLSPPQGNDIDDMNDLSLVLLAEYTGVRMLLCGDASQTIEESILPLGHIDLLVAGHHGSRTATGEALLDDITPAYAFISCGRDNEYGHPHREVLDRLEKAGAQVLRTDESGVLTARVIQGKLRVTAERAASPAA